jgi:hypothetical protein
MVYQKPLFKPTPAFHIFVSPTPTPKPKLQRAPTAVPVSRKLAVSITPEPIATAAQTLVFDKSGFSLYLKALDGDGRYKVEVVDFQNRHVKTLFNKRVEIDSERWLVWDGKDEEGKNVPPGRYLALFTRDGVIFNRMLLLR